ncbi:hypothetical protein ACFRCR_18335 [Oerskovia sp. NPDC056781]|uniref:hypothetical protein n=1 Tax=Oerskovia sp. NPDC056781 TaxID=3345942 RepID=UPI003672C88E
MPFLSVRHVETVRGREPNLCLVGQARRDRDTHEIVASAARVFGVLRAASNDHDVPSRRLSGRGVERAERLPAPEDHRRSVRELLDRPYEPQPATDALDRTDGSPDRATDRAHRRRRDTTMPS